jgi:hypothetical protein
LSVEAWKWCGWRRKGMEDGRGLGYGRSMKRGNGKSTNLVLDRAKSLQQRMLLRIRMLWLGGKDGRMRVKKEVRGCDGKR